MKTLQLAIAASMLAAAAPAGAATTQWGVTALTAWADCTVLACDKLSFALLGNPIVTDTQSGGLNVATAEQIDIPQVHDTIVVGSLDMGLASARVELDPASLSVPVLKARASSNSSNGWVGALAFALQGYQYTGVGPTTINLDAALTGTVVDPDDSDVTGLSVGIWLVRSDPAVTFPSPPPTSIAALAQYVSLLPVEDFWTIDEGAAGAVDASTLAAGDPISIAVDPGDEFYVIAGLVAAATGSGADADAFSTLTMQFDTTALVPAGVVPLPGAAWLLSPILGLGLLLRRR
ncbi:MAG: hypothetical protein AB7Q97_21395 [Gammaproteobacteria bacterium]